MFSWGLCALICALPGAAKKQQNAEPKPRFTMKMFQNVPAKLVMPTGNEPRPERVRATTAPVAGARKWSRSSCTTMQSPFLSVCGFLLLHTLVFPSSVKTWRFEKLNAWCCCTIIHRLDCNFCSNRSNASLVNAFVNALSRRFLRKLYVAQLIAQRVSGPVAQIFTIQLMQ